jgi:plastocyanin
MKYKLLLVSGFFLVMAAIFVISCGKSSGYGSGTSTGTGTGSTTSSLSIINMAFSPGSTTVKAGTTVKWTNNDGITHTVTADNNSFDSGNLASGATFSKTFSVTGTYAYHCTIHPGMTGTIIVN